MTDSSSGATPHPLTRWLTYQAATAGRSGWVWSVFVALMVIEGVGEISDLPGQFAPVREVLWRVIAIGWTVVPTWAVGADPYHEVIASPWPGWGNLAAAAALVTLLAVLRVHRGTSPRAQALRIGAAVIARLVMVAYVLHLVVWRATPVLVALTVVSAILLALFVVGAALVVRFGAGRRPADMPTVKRSGLRFLGRLAAGAAAVVVLGLLPAAERGATTDVALPVADVYRALVSGNDLILAAATPTWVDVRVVSVSSGTPRWSQRIDLGEAQSAPVDVELAASRGSVYIQIPTASTGGASYALTREDGSLRWSRPSGRLAVTPDTVVVHDGEWLFGLAEASGETIWSLDVTPDARLDSFQPTRSSTIPDLPYLLAITDSDGRFRIVDPISGAVHRDLAAFAADPDLAVVANGRVVRIATQAPYVVTAEEVPEYGAWTFEAPEAAGSVTGVVPCGHSLCISDETGLTSLDTTTGRVRWQRTDLPGQITGSADGRILVRAPTGTIVVDPWSGATVAVFPGQVAYPLDSQRLLLIEETSALASVYDIWSYRWLRLGRIVVDPSTCAWGGATIVCAGATARVWTIRM